MYHNILMRKGLYRNFWMHVCLNISHEQVDYTYIENKQSENITLNSKVYSLLEGVSSDRRTVSTMIHLNLRYNKQQINNLFDNDNSSPANIW